MIRLGSLAGYPFEGPRLLGGWTPPASPAVYAVMYKPDPEAKPETYAVIYVGHGTDAGAPTATSGGLALRPGLLLCLPRGAATAGAGLPSYGHAALLGLG